jgi:hypothetical protein
MGLGGIQYVPFISIFLFPNTSDLCDMWFLYLRMRFVGGSHCRFYPCVSDYRKLVWLSMDMCGPAFLHLFLLPVGLGDTYILIAG